MWWRDRIRKAGINFELWLSSFPKGILRNILDLFYKLTWSMWVKLWNNTCTTFHCYLSMSFAFLWEMWKKVVLYHVLYKWLNMSSSASKEMAASCIIPRLKWQFKKATVGRWCKGKHSARYVPRMTVHREKEIKAIFNSYDCNDINLCVKLPPFSKENSIPPWATKSYKAA